MVSLLEGIQLFTKHEKIHTGENPNIWSTVHPSNLNIKIGGNHVNRLCVARASITGLTFPISREFIMQRHKCKSVANPSGGIQASKDIR